MSLYYYNIKLSYRIWKCFFFFFFCKTRIPYKIRKVVRSITINIPSHEGKKI